MVYPFLLQSFGKEVKNDKAFRRASDQFCEKFDWFSEGTYDSEK